LERIKIELVKPEKIDAKEIKVLEFREPIGADLESIIGEFSSGDKKAIGKAMTELAAKLIVNEPITADDFRKFSAKNYMAVINELMSFLL